MSELRDIIATILSHFEANIKMMTTAENREEYRAENRAENSKEDETILPVNMPNFWGRMHRFSKVVRVIGMTLEGLSGEEIGGLDPFLEILLASVVFKTI